MAQSITACSSRLGKLFCNLDKLSAISITSHTSCFYRHRCAWLNFFFFFFFFLRHHALEFTPSPHPLPACRLKESRSAPPPPPTSRRAGGAPAWDRLPAPVREELVRQDFQIWTGRVRFGPHSSAPHDPTPLIGTVTCIKHFLVGCDYIYLFMPKNVAIR